MKISSHSILIITLFTSFTVWAENFHNKVVEVDKIQTKIMIDSYNITCGSSSGGGTYGGGVTRFHGAIRNIHESRVLNSFGYSINFGNPYGCKGIKKALDEGDEGFVLVNEVLETVASDGHFSVECNVSYRMKGASSLRVGARTYDLSSGRFYRFSPIHESHRGVSCRDLFKR
jgi:hypothetical protein